MRMTTNIAKAVWLAHRETCPRCIGQSPCPIEIGLWVQWKLAVLYDRPRYHYTVSYSSPYLRRKRS